MTYCLFAFLFTIIPVNTSFIPPEDGVEIFVRSNSVHTDIILPVNTKDINWNEIIDTNDYIPSLYPFTYISFGWGDKGFFIETPEWKDLKFRVAFKAGFLPSATAMHVAYLDEKPAIDDLTKRLTITEQQYHKLIEYIKQSFQTDNNDEVMLINCISFYDTNDNFYEAHGSFNIFNTCNVWTNKALKEAGIRTAFWAPFDKCVFYHLDRINK